MDFTIDYTDALSLARQRPEERFCREVVGMPQQLRANWVANPDDLEEVQHADDPEDCEVFLMRDDDEQLRAFKVGSTPEARSFRYLHATVLHDPDALKMIISRALRKTNDLRADEGDPKAACLFVCDDIAHSQRVAAIVAELTKVEPVVVNSDVSVSVKLIEKFRESSAAAIVSVGMISEGVDIPRLRVACILSNIKSELRWRQIIGRVMRCHTPVCTQESWPYGNPDRTYHSEQPDINAWIYFPADPVQWAYHARMERMVLSSIRDGKEGAPRVARCQCDLEPDCRAEVKLTNGRRDEDCLEGHCQCRQSDPPQGPEIEFEEANPIGASSREGEHFGQGEVELADAFVVQNPEAAMMPRATIMKWAVEGTIVLKQGLDRVPTPKAVKDKLVSQVLARQGEVESAVKDCMGPQNLSGLRQLKVIPVGLRVLVKKQSGQKQENPSLLDVGGLRESLTRWDELLDRIENDPGAAETLVPKIISLGQGVQSDE